MTTTFVDSASIHGALSALLIGKGRLAKTPWEQQSLLEVTYLLLHANVHIVPGPSPYSGPSGPFQHLLQRFPLLEQPSLPELSAATARTKTWARGNVKRLAEALTRLETNNVSQEYCNNSAECFWVHHVKMYGTLFNHNFIPWIAPVLGCTQADLQRICDSAANLNQVKQWARSAPRTGEAKLAERAYWLSSLLRGRVHEHVAADTRVSLVAHPVRKAVQLKLTEHGLGKPVFTSEETFTKIIIGAALRERDPEHRIVTWADTVSKARNAILTGAVALPQTVLERQGQEYAFQAAKRLAVAGQSRIIARAIDVTVSLGFPMLLALTVSPWGALTPIGTQAYRYFAGASVGDQLARAARSTRQNFRTLAKIPPGRIERHLRPNSH